LKVSEKSKFLIFKNFIQTSNFASLFENLFNHPVSNFSQNWKIAGKPPSHKWKKFQEKTCFSSKNNQQNLYQKINIHLTKKILNSRDALLIIQMTILRCFYKKIIQNFKIRWKKYYFNFFLLRLRTDSFERRNRNKFIFLKSENIMLNFFTCFCNWTPGGV
jgi:hypothetical protein